MANNKVTDSIIYVGVNDRKIDLFEGQYNVPNGISYNSYLIKDEKTVVMDTVDKNAGGEWLKNLKEALNGEKPDYLVVSHLEPDHSYNIEKLCELFPEMKIVGNAKTFAFLPQFFNIENLNERQVLVKDGDSLNIGKHILNFVMAPMVHWPEVMFTYESTEKVLFSADAFGKFGDLKTDEPWLEEARRYYINIVGKYGIQVQAVLKKANTLDIKIICPLHGPILTEKLEYYLNKYDIWSSYKPEEKGTLIAYASIYGNTEMVSKKLASLLEQTGEKVVLKDLARCDIHEAISDAFKFDKLILASPTYNAGIFTPMEQFLNSLKEKNFQNRKVGIIENGTWAPLSGKAMTQILSQMKDITIADTQVTIKTRMNTENETQLENLINEMIK
ncbi:MAG: FprA family A-type flavoprotein [Clostridia bacterium]|nr:FprA family A-type flavoprotein [Clostridia bacterium]